jgi:ABC-type uncharacterized transport system auxiliary subunit
MRPIAKLLLGFTIIASSGCALTRKPRVIEVYLLEPKITASHSRAALLPAGTRIVVDEIEASSLLKSNNILFGRDSLTRGKYQYSEWETPVPIRLQRILANALQTSNQFLRVAENEVIGLPAWKLKVEITDFYHDAQNSPGEIVIRLNASLITPKGASTSTPKLFEVRKPAHSFNAHGAVLSINEAIAQLIPDLVEWTISGIRKFRK